MIKGGYYIKARCIQESDIAIAPPHVREIWDWLIQAMLFDAFKTLKRGQSLIGIRDIQEGLKWFVGYRKETYSKSQCEMALNWLRKHDMIQTTKTTRGMLVTVCNYGYYQDIKNYEKNNENSTRATRDEQTPDRIEKEGIKEDEKKEGLKENNIKEISERAIAYLNRKTGANFKPANRKTLEFIQARVNEGFVADDFKTVIDKKLIDWKDDAEFKKFLRPLTLFSNKFESYLNQPESIPSAASSTPKPGVYPGKIGERPRNY